MLYSRFYKEYGIRRASHLATPPLFPLDSLVLPFNSTYHYIERHSDVVPDVDDVVLSHAQSRKTLVRSILEYTANKMYGTPSKITSVTPMAVAQQVKQNRQFTPYTTGTAAFEKETRVLKVVNYGPLDKAYRYIDHPLSDYHRWMNHFRTVIQQLIVEATASDRQNFIKIEVPLNIPPLSIIKRIETISEDITTESYLSKQSYIDWAEVFYSEQQVGNLRLSAEDMSSSQVRFITNIFDTDSAKFFLDMLLWVGPNPQKSVLSTIPPNLLDKTNVILVIGSKWCVLNLGLVAGWIVGKRPGLKNEPMKPQEAQKRMLIFAVHLKNSLTPGMAEVEEDSNDDGFDLEDTPKIVARNEFGEIETDDDGEEMPAQKIKMKLSRPDMRAHDDKDQDNLSLDDEVDVTSNLDAVGDMSETEVDAEIELLETVFKNDQLKEVENTGYKAYEPRPDTLEQKVIDVALEFAARGKISAAEYRRMETLATSYQRKKNPLDKSQLFLEMLEIEPEALAISETNKFVEDLDGVIDKSMLSNSLIQFDSKYITEIMQKDILNVAMVFQKKGCAVKDISVEEVNDLNDSFRVYSIKVVPPYGKETTCKVRLPIVDENGIFKSSGVQYRMRKQRGDVPIRKVAPDTVAMTSYHSKIFVTRSERAAFNLTNWLTATIISKGINVDDNSVTEMKLSGVFNSKAKLPRHYTILSTKMSAFKSGEYEFHFDYNTQAEYFGQEITDKIRESAKQKDRVVTLVGKAGDDYLLMNDQDIIARYNPKENSVTPLGTILDIVGIPTDKLPIEYVDVTIMSKAIPLGFILARHIGLGNLLKTLNVDPIRVAKGSHRPLQSDEWAIRFEDETLIFSRKDKLAMSILNGFNRYTRDIKNYSVYMFDKKDVYASILDNNGITVRYLRKIDNIFDLWMDHITENLLIEMEEPTDMFLLFISAATKLLNDDHPAPMDMRYQRDKGYERFAGIMYGELARALEIYSARPMHPNASVDLNPEAVWYGIMDQTVMPIEQSNPIHSLKEREVVVFRGVGGRSSRSMTAVARMYDVSAIGTVSEATPDNGDVATITYLTADPSYTSVRGTTRTLTKDQYYETPTKVVSTSMMMSAGADKDD